MKLATVKYRNGQKGWPFVITDDLVTVVDVEVYKIHEKHPLRFINIYRFQGLYFTKTSPKPKLSKTVLSMGPKTITCRVIFKCDHKRLF